MDGVVADSDSLPQPGSDSRLHDITRRPDAFTRIDLSINNPTMPTTKGPVPSQLVHGMTNGFFSS